MWDADCTSRLVEFWAGPLSPKRRRPPPAARPGPKIHQPTASVGATLAAADCTSLLSYIEQRRQVHGTMNLTSLVDVVFCIRSVPAYAPADIDEPSSKLWPTQSLLQGSSCSELQVICTCGQGERDRKAGLQASAAFALHHVQMTCIRSCSCCAIPVPIPAPRAGPSHTLIHSKCIAKRFFMFSLKDASSRLTPFTQEAIILPSFPM